MNAKTGFFSIVTENEAIKSNKLCGLKSVFAINNMIKQIKTVNRDKIIRSVLFFVSLLSNGFSL